MALGSSLPVSSQRVPKSPASRSASPCLQAPPPQAEPRFFFFLPHPSPSIRLGFPFFRTLLQFLFSGGGHQAFEMLMDLPSFRLRGFLPLKSSALLLYQRENLLQDYFLQVAAPLPPRFLSSSLLCNLLSLSSSIFFLAGFIYSPFLSLVFCSAVFFDPLKGLPAFFGPSAGFSYSSFSLFSFLIRPVLFHSLFWLVFQLSLFQISPPFLFRCFVSFPVRPKFLGRWGGAVWSLRPLIKK